MIYLWVGLAGGIGAILRFTVSRIALYYGWVGFPYATLFVNVVGSFLIGLLVLLLQTRFGASDHLKTALVTGLLGGFTTFSAFSLETVSFIEHGELVKALTYVSLTLLSCLLACALGMFVAKNLV